MTPDDLDRVLVVIPTFNERENLPLILGRLRAAVPTAEVLVVDDSSPDGTGELADAAAEVDPRIHVLHRTSKDGLGQAYLTGFRWALERGYGVVVEMDADGSHAPEELPQMLRALTDADVVLGSRYVPGGVVRNWPLSRLVLSRGGNIYVRVLLRMPLKDATGGYRAYRASVLRALELHGVSSQGYCFQVDLARRSWQAGYRVVEVPITFTEREHGQSKMSGSIVREALWRVTLWGLSSRPGAIRRRALTTRSATSAPERPRG